MTSGSTDVPEGVHSTGDVDGGALTVPQSNVLDASGADSDAFAVLFGGETEEWLTQTSKKGFRASWPITVLVALLLLVGGISLGAFLQRGQSTSSTSSTSALAGRFGAAFGAASKTGTSATGAASATSGVTTGTVTDIIGKTLYVTNASGALVAVKVTSATTVTRNASSSLSALKPGDTVTVQGPTQKNGSVEATTISAAAKGVTTVGGFGGFGAGASGAASTGTGSGTSASTSG